MTVARAFGYLRYNADVVGDPGALLAPPYDVISEPQRQELAARAPWQSVLLELPEGGDGDAAGRLLRRWIEEGVLEAGEVGVAVVQQRYVGPDGVRRTRIGVACEVALHDFSDGQVLPHEQTFEGPRQQRLDLMRATGANVSPVFLLYHDSERLLADVVSSVTDEPPDFTATEADGTQTAVWFVTDLAICDSFEQAVAPHPLLIADGHHRYTAALAYRDEVRAAGPALSLVGGSEHAGPPHHATSGPDGVLAVVSNSADAGINIFPTHRVLEGSSLEQLDRWLVAHRAFRCDVHDEVDDAMLQLEGLDVPGFVVHHRSRTRTFSLADPAALERETPGATDAFRSLDVVALHALVIDGGAGLGQSCSRMSYTRSLDEALAQVAEADDRIGFLMRAAEVPVVHEVARAGELLPQKSTYFFPKVPTGVVFREL